MHATAIESINYLKETQASLDSSVTLRLKSLDEFSENLRQNLLKVNTNERRVAQNEKMIRDFKNDDIFINAWNNYTNVYQE